MKRTIIAVVATSTRVVIIYSGRLTARNRSAAGLSTSFRLESPLGMQKDLTDSKVQYEDGVPGTLITAKASRSPFLSPGATFRLTAGFLRDEFTGVVGRPASVDPQGTVEILASIDKAGRAVSSSIAAAADKVTTAVGAGVSPVTNQVDDLNTFALLTESLDAQPGGGRSRAPSLAGSTSLSVVAASAVQQVLGWKGKPDSKAFLGALTQSFSCTEFEGRSVVTWTPRTYAVQTDLSGGISGAQASLYSRAEAAISKSKDLLDGLKPLRLNADPEDMLALKAIVGRQMGHLLAELGQTGGPRLQRVDQHFELLLGPGTTVTDPDAVLGQIGKIRAEFGLASGFPGTGPDLVNTVEEEQYVTNYRILSDYLTSLRISWINNRNFFRRGPGDPAFFGTRLVHLTRQFGVIAESVDELKMIFDSVFIEDDERGTLEIVFSDGDRMFLEELLGWIYSFATEEGPCFIQEGGKYGVQTACIPVIQKLISLAAQAAVAPNMPRGYRTPRVRRAWDEISVHLETLRDLALPIQHNIPAQ